jgi:hypothetical protein
MTRLLRFADLESAGIVKSWAQLKRLQALYDFPPGRMLSPNVRVWGEDEINRWLKNRPTAGPEPRGAARTRREARRRKAMLPEMEA